MAGPQAKSSAGVDQTSPKLPSPGEYASKDQILKQSGKFPFSPARIAVGGFAVVLTLGYFVLFSNKKAEVSALDVAKVTTGLATPENTRPRK